MNKKVSYQVLAYDCYDTEIGDYCVLIYVHSYDIDVTASYNINTEEFTVHLYESIVDEETDNFEENLILTKEFIDAKKDDIIK